ncbi:putative membrane protein YccC [Alkalibacillus flavidus]|uniref:Membrane protein YccC n=1 Tax=Alkalibacillus flavidus TaxID=546021 RepID=A0ABV2KQQ7_9BACI
MIPRMLTYLLLGIVLLAGVAYFLPQYIHYIWIALSVAFVFGLAMLVYIYGKRVLLLMKELKKD